MPAGLARRDSKDAWDVIGGVREQAETAFWGLVGPSVAGLVAWREGLAGVFSRYVEDVEIGMLGKALMKQPRSHPPILCCYPGRKTGTPMFCCLEQAAKATPEFTPRGIRTRDDLYPQTARGGARTRVRAYGETRVGEETGCDACVWG
jgi:hypothetical protein